MPACPVCSVSLLLWMNATHTGPACSRSCEGGQQQRHGNTSDKAAAAAATAASHRAAGALWWCVVFWECAFAVGTSSCLPACLPVCRSTLLLLLAPSQPCLRSKGILPHCPSLPPSIPAGPCLPRSEHAGGPIQGNAAAAPRFSRASAVALWGAAAARREADQWQLEPPARLVTRRKPSSRNTACAALVDITAVAAAWL